MIENTIIDGFISGIVNIDNRLSNVEVKGDSVEKLLSARMLLKQLADEIEKLRPKENIEKEE